MCVCTVRTVPVPQAAAVAMWSGAPRMLGWERAELNPDKGFKLQNVIFVGTFSLENTSLGCWQSSSYRDICAMCA